METSLSLAGEPKSFLNAGNQKKEVNIITSFQKLQMMEV